MMEQSIFYAEMKSRQVFEQVEELNEFIKNVRYFFADQLNETDRLVLDYMAQNAVKYFGVFGQKVATAAAALEKGVATVRRSLAKLERLGIIKRCEYIRPKSGGNGANIVVFIKDAVKESRPVKNVDNSVSNFFGAAGECPADRPSDRPQVSARPDAASPDAASAEGAIPQDKTLNSSKALDKAQENKKRINTYSARAEKSYEESFGKEKEEQPEELGTDYAHYEVPESFKRAVVPMGRDPKSINFAWSKVRMAHRKHGLDKLGVSLESLVADEEFLSELVRRAKSVVGGFKTGSVHDFGAVLYTAMYNLFREVVEEVAQEVRQAAGYKGVLWQYEELRADQSGELGEEYLAGAVGESMPSVEVYGNSAYTPPCASWYGL